MIYTIGAILQVMGVIMNGALLLSNYRQYRKDRMFLKAYIALITLNVFMLFFCAFFLLFNVGKATGRW